jgi:hypothetical protein
MYEIYRSKQNPQHYVAVEADDNRENAVGVRQSPNLSFLARVAEEGDPRIAFDPEKARSRIARDGFYAFDVKVRPREASA